MSEFRTIEIDFEIHKLMEQERRNFAERDHVILRRLLKLDPPNDADQTSGRPWIGNGITLPHGTRLRMRQNGVGHLGEIRDGKWVIEDKTFNSPSGAASGVALTSAGKRTRLDGWKLWEVKRPGEIRWTKLSKVEKGVPGFVIVIQDKDGRQQA